MPRRTSANIQYMHSRSPSGSADFAVAAGQSVDPQAAIVEVPALVAVPVAAVPEPEDLGPGFHGEYVITDA